MEWAASECGPISIRFLLHRHDGGGPHWSELRRDPRRRPLIARHERCYGHQQQVLELEHYLDVLERKPGALTGSKPLAALAGKRALAIKLRPAADETDTRHGKASGTRQMIQIIGLVKQYGHRPAAGRSRRGALARMFAMPRRSGICYRPVNWRANVRKTLSCQRHSPL